MNYLERSVENKKIIWFEESNRYSLLEMHAYEVIVRLIEGEKKDRIARWLTGHFHLPKSESRRFINEIQQLVELQSGLNESDPGKFAHELSDAVPTHFYSIKHYNLNNCIYSAEFETEDLEYLIHPKFIHLEVNEIDHSDHCFQVFRYQESFVLRVNDAIIGQWLPGDFHYLIGKFYMELLNRMYHKTDRGWMGVFHASAISRGNRSILFLGDSGNGKSTICAILSSCGFDLLADDFVPVDSASREVFFFPAAVSVKKNALDQLIPLFPQLESSAEFYYPGLDKTVRYLAPSRQSENLASSYPCKALIFVKYQKDSLVVKDKGLRPRLRGGRPFAGDDREGGVVMEKMPKDVAFQHLVPDSWISPLPENAERFLDWFLELPCYQLTYSDNQAMVEVVRGVFDPPDLPLPPPWKGGVSSGVI